MLIESATFPVIRFLRLFPVGVITAILLAAAVAGAPRAYARVYSCDNALTVVGLDRTYRVRDGESLIEIARRFDLGYNEITEANPGIDPFVPGKGTIIALPTSWVLPETASRDGIVINLSEMRLYYYFTVNGARYVRTFPVGIGRQGDLTPVGRFKVVEKIVGPAWHVPESIREENPALPKVVPAGPGNPLGSHALRLSLPTILIHGTNKPWGVGRRVSHGCIRLYPEDIPRLFALVSRGTDVEIVHQPVKVGTRNGRIYIEVHRNGHGENVDYFPVAVRLLTDRGLLKLVNTKKLYKAVDARRGMPVDITE
ncbi:MAG: L,D-transpeptidase family protein [Candidatus Sulfobium sp.]|jgi:L,D-transpeptidase ErfK/SrfK